MTGTPFVPDTWFTLDAKAAARNTLGTRRIFNVAADYGAVGDNATDCYDAIMAAQADAYPVKGVVFFPAGIYRVRQPVEFKVSWEGENGQSVLRAGASFTGSMLVDFNSPALKKHMHHMAFDAQSKAGVQCFGSTGDASGSSQGTFINVDFVNTAPGVYAVGGSSSTNTGGMLTGARFHNCMWTNCAQPLAAGQNQDDTVFIGSRFVMTPGNRPTDAPFLLTGQNIHLLTSYLYAAGTDNTADDVKPLFKIGNFPVTIRGLFIEANAAIEYTHIFATAFSGVRATIEAVRWTADVTAAFKAAACVGVNAAAGYGPSLTLRDIQGQSGNNPLLVEIKASSAVDGAFTKVLFSGCDDWGGVAAFRAANSSNARIALVGDWRDTTHAYTVTPTGGMGVKTPLTPTT